MAHAGGGVMGAQTVLAASVLPTRFQKFTIDPSGCWLWTGSLDVEGYPNTTTVGSRTDGTRRSVRLHRAIYEILRAPVDSSLDLDHKCHTADESCAGGRKCVHRRCVNPWHLEPVSHRENILRGNTLAARYAARDQCGNGHSLEGANVRRTPRGRICRACTSVVNRKQYLKRKAAMA